MTTFTAGTKVRLKKEFAGYADTIGIRPGKVYTVCETITDGEAGVEKVILEGRPSVQVNWNVLETASETT